MRGAYHSESVWLWCVCDCALVDVGGVSCERRGAGDSSGHVSEKGTRTSKQQLFKKNITTIKYTHHIMQLQCTYHVLV